MIEAKDTQSTTTHEANSPSAFERLRPEEPVLRLYALDHKIERGDENINALLLAANKRRSYEAQAIT